MADLIKKIKIKKQDGTFTDYIPIGAEAENVNVDDESVEVKLNKKPYYYNSVADMKADTKLKIGDFVKTLGYYNAGDPGGSYYYISDNKYETLPDNRIYIYASILLDNGLYATLVLDNNEISIAQLGAKADTDITELLQLAISCYRYVLIPKNNYIISSTILIPGGGNLIGVHRRYSILSYTGTDFALKVQYGSQIKDIGIDCTAGTYTQDNNIMGEISTNPCCVQTWTRENVSGIEFIAAHSFAQRVEVKNASLYGFRPNSYCEISDCLAMNCKYSYAPHTDNVISDCVAQMCEIPIYLNDSHSNRIVNMRVDECTKHFVYINEGEANIVDFLGGQAHQSGIVINQSHRNRISGLVSRCSQISRGKTWEDSIVPIDDYVICETSYCTNNEYDITVQIGDSYLYNQTTHSYFPKRILSAENSYSVYKIVTPFATSNDTYVQHFNDAHSFDFSPYFNITFARATIYINQIKLSFNGRSSYGYYIDDMGYNIGTSGLGNYIRFQSGKLIFGFNGNEYKVIPDETPS